MDQSLPTDPHAEIRAEVAKLCARFPGEYWRKLDRDRAYPTEFVRALTEAGYLAALIPEEYGGAGLPLSGCRGDPRDDPRRGLQWRRLPCADVHHGHHSAARLAEAETGVPAQDRHGRTTPAGVRRDRTDQRHRHHELRTFAKRDGDHYVVNGQKVWTSRAEHSDLMLLLARTTPRDQAKRRTDGLSTFIVDMRASVGHGMTIRPLRTMMNHNSTEIFFDNMVVPAENLIGEEGKGFRYILDGMNAERLLISAECIGDARWFLKKATDYARDRQVFGRPIGQNQGIQFPLARAYAQMRAAELMIRDGCAKFEAGLTPGEEANMAKLLGADASWAAAEACLQTHGGFGFAEEYDVERKYRETRLYQVAPISTNLILSYIAEHVLGLPRSY